MAPLLKTEVDASSLLAALKQLGDRAEKHVKAAAKVTADRVATEARSRAARRTGETAASVTVEESRDGKGWVVLPWDFTKPSRMPNLPIWLEFGTKHMTPRPYFFSSARLEEAAHERRIAEAVQAAIDEVGLGD